MKILQINTVCGKGSTGRIAVAIHNTLKAKGHESFMAYGRGEPKDCETAIKIGNKIDVYYHVLLTRLLDQQGYGSKKATISFIDKVDEIKPDIIHLHNVHGYYLNLEVLFNYLKDKKVLWTFHDCWPFTGHCAYFDYIKCDKWEKRCYDCPQIRTYPKSFFKDNSKKNFDLKKKLFTSLQNLTLVTPSNWLNQLVKKSFMGKYSVKTINNGIDLEIFKPRSSSFREKQGIGKKFMILGVASPWSERKGYKYFLELSDKLEKDEILVMVGLSKKQIHDLPSNIIGIKRTENAIELAEIYSTADVFVNTTLEDNFPTTNLESMACGTPVVSFDSGGSSECFDKYTGIVVEKESISDLRSAVDVIKRQRKKTFKDVCIKRATSFYNQGYKFLEYVGLYYDVYQKH